MMASVRIRRATPEDAEAILFIYVVRRLSGFGRSRGSRGYPIRPAMAAMKIVKSRSCRQS